MTPSRSSATPLRDKLLSNSPDPIKSSILRESGMGWSSPPSDKSNGNATSPLRISKRDSPKPTQADLARRSSSSYRHMRNNNLVTKSPFKSQIPMPSTPSRNQPIPFPSGTRRVSGEKRPRPASLHEQGETENDRPFALKRERKQSKTYQGLIQKEPVTKSPFRRLHSTSNQHYQPELPIHVESMSRSPLPTFSSSPPKSSIPAPGTSPMRSSLVSKRMHGPRLSGGKRQKRKTVTWGDSCDVIEISDPEDHDEDDDDEMMESDEGIYGHPEENDDADSFFRTPFTDNSSVSNEPTPDNSYESIQLSDNGSNGLELDPDASITGLVDEMFSSQRTSTPPRTSVNDHPTDLETEDGVPFGRSHHAERVKEYRQSHESHVHASPLPLSTLQEIKIPVEPTAFSTPPSTPPRNSPLQSPVSSPPLGRTTHAERVELLKAARAEEEEIEKDVKMLPDSPSPMKPSRSGAETLAQGTVPKFDLGIDADSSLKMQHTSGPDPFELPPLKNEEFPAANDSSLQLDQDSRNLSTVSTEHSEVDLSAMEEKLGETNARLLNTSMEASPLGLRNASFSYPTNSPRRSPLAGLPSRMSPALRSTRSPSPASPSGRPRITRDEVQRRLLHKRSFGSPSPSNSPRSSLRGSVSLQHIEVEERAGTPNEKDKDAVSVLTTGTENSAEMAVIETAEKRVVSVGIFHQHEAPETEHSVEVEKSMDLESLMQTQPDRNHVRDEDVSDADQQDNEDQEKDEEDDDEDDEDFGILKPPTSNDKLKLDFGSKFGLGKLGFSDVDMDLDIEPSQAHRPALTSDPSGSNLGVVTLRASDSLSDLGRAEVAPVDVDMDMRSALDRLMDDVAGAGGVSVEHRSANTSMTTEEDDSFTVDKRILPPQLRHMERAATDSALMDYGHDNLSSSSTPPPAVPPKDNIRAREALILEKRREMRRMQEEEDEDFHGRRNLGIGLGRPSRRRSMSTGDAENLSNNARKRSTAMGGRDALLQPAVSSQEDLQGSIEKELHKNDSPRKKKYHIREHEGTIYASADADKVSHMAGPGDVNAGKAWRTVRRPSDMNEYSKQIKEYRAQDKSKAYGKVFVKVLGVKGLHVPIPQEPTAFSCTLNNGIHFVTTPDCRFGKDGRIEQEFELIEHSKLEFTLTLKVRRDPHIISQFKAVVPPPPQPVAPPPMVQQSSSKGGLRSFFSSSPKKGDKGKKSQPQQPQLPPQMQPVCLTENLARYLKPDGTLARAFISFKDIAF
ncbi:Bud site selection protein bud4 [Stygiomarasmius scandens]|uniref:Bud site selection protein bud4 n=1 Tax=Marasmiellus scandens TaxID=2682957 RepID=A0ABR1KA28_9AGAR